MNERKSKKFDGFLCGPLFCFWQKGSTVSIKTSLERRLRKERNQLNFVMIRFTSSMRQTANGKTKLTSLMQRQTPKIDGKEIRKRKTNETFFVSKQLTENHSFTLIYVGKPNPSLIPNDEINIFCWWHTLTANSWITLTIAKERLSFGWKFEFGSRQSTTNPKHCAAQGKKEVYCSNYVSNDLYLIFPVARVNECISEPNALNLAAWTHSNAHIFMFRNHNFEWFVR